MPWKGTDNRARRKVMKTAIDAMPPFRRVTGPATRLRIKATLRPALNDAIGQQILPNRQARSSTSSRRTGCTRCGT
ncbi:hypothetical protein AB0B60_26020 [Streptomyces lincolnensis]|nr:hypothetical protein [Streptomyces lincolnensis]